MASAIALSHQCLSAFCGVVTASVIPTAIRRDYVTNAFRPFVVLLLCTEKKTQSLEALSPMPFGLLWCCYSDAKRMPSAWPDVTNAFRPFVVLLLQKSAEHSPEAMSHQCLSAFCGVVTWVHIMDS